MQEETYKVKLTLEDQFVIEPEVEQTLVRILMLKGEKGDKGDAGEGDMNKSVYDTNDDGKVNAADNADTVNNHTVNDDVPTDFFSGDATTTAEGTDFTLTDALTLKSVDLKGDTTQTTLSGKNLILITLQSTELNGVTYTVNADKSITMSGKATSRSEPRLYQSGTGIPAMVLKAGVTYHNSTDELLYWYSGNYHTLQAGQNYTPSVDETIQFLFIRVEADVTVEKTIYPQLEEGDHSTTYEPYCGGIPSPNPDYPQNVNVVTGTQTITISDGTLSEDFTVDLGSIELAKIGTYQDYIYKSGDDWYVHKAILKLNMSDITGWGAESAGNMYCTGFQNTYHVVKDTMYSNIFTYNSTAWSGKGRFGIGSTGAIWIMTGDTTLTQGGNVPAWLTNKGAIMYAIMATPTDTKITDSTLIEELNALWHAYMYDETTSLASSGSLPAILSVEAFNKNANGIAGAIKTINSGL